MREKNTATIIRVAVYSVFYRCRCCKILFEAMAAGYFKGHARRHSSDGLWHLLLVLVAD